MGRKHDQRLVVRVKPNETRAHALQEAFKKIDKPPRKVILREVAK